jgi:hypothetical protein
MAGISRRLFANLLAGQDAAFQVGMGGLIGLGIAGWVTLPLGMLPNGLRWGIWVVAGVAVIGLWFTTDAILSKRIPLSVPRGPSLAIGCLLAAALFVAAIGALGPSDLQEWDSLAYHLAVPKLWLEAGRIEYLPSIHQSNFPFLVDNLFVWGLAWGGESGAKAFSLLYACFGALALFGFARSRYGAVAAWWSALAFAGIPVVLWESGTAYVDAAHGVWSGLAILLAARFAEAWSDRRDFWQTAICMGASLSSKFTGFQVVAAVCAALLAMGVRNRIPAVATLKVAVLAACALAIASPWLIRNGMNTGNPVYPFFYEVFGSRNWDQARADIYRNEQRSFGVGQGNLASLPHAVLGLVYQPGRYVNPGQMEGRGSPTGALGAAAIAALLVWLASGRMRRFEWTVVATVALCFVFWFFLSQQSRYATNMAAPLCVLLGGGVERLRAGFALGFVALGQAVYSVWLVGVASCLPKLPVVLGAQSANDYRTTAIPFFEASRAVNREARQGKVALYDEVFGYLLDVPYFWANPGHSTLIPYERLRNGREYADEMRKLGFTHAYMRFAFTSRPQQEAWLAEALSWTASEGYTDEERRALSSDWQSKWRLLLAEAVRSRELEPVWASQTGILLQFRHQKRGSPAP